MNKYNVIMVSCPLCGAGVHRHERMLQGFTLVRCCECALVFVNPQLDRQALNDLYVDKNDPTEIIALYARLATPRVLAEYDRKLLQIESLLGRKGRILDFACAGAYFIERAALRGWESHGLDIGSWVKFAAEKRGVENVHIGTLADIRFPEGYFDVIYAAQVLEHLPAPRGTLAELKNILRGDGILYVDVPNYRTIPVMAGKDDFFLNSPPQHINYFTPRTLTRLLRASGYCVKSVTTEGGLKWENLLGRRVTSDIAEAYRRGNEGGEARRVSSWPTMSGLKELLRPIASTVFYQQLKVGMNLVVFARPEVMMQKNLNAR